MANDSLYNDLDKKYAHKTTAEALFFKTVFDTPAFRFEATDLGWEFSEGFYIGPDPKGIFFYNDDFFNLDPNRSTTAEYYVDQWFQQGERYAYIKFYAPGSGHSKLLAEFLGKDTYNVTGSSGLLQQNRSGSWKKTGYVVGNATAIKAASTTGITIQCKPLHKAAKFDCTSGDKVYGDAVEIDGRLTIKDIDEVGKATAVRWYHDYVVFLENTNAKDFSAFFFPQEGPKKDPLGTQAYGYWENVRWERV